MIIQGLREHLVRQSLDKLVSFPCYSILCATVGILLTAATQNRYGKPLWSLPALFSTIIDDQGSRSRVAAFFGGAALSVSQMGLNVPANALAGGCNPSLFLTIFSQLTSS